MSDLTLPRYDIHQTYQWNYDHAPDPVECDQTPVIGEYNVCGLPVGSPLGIAAGPLLNGRWVLYYASLGFDVLTYKTVRTQARDCYALPNLLPVTAKRLNRAGDDLEVDASMRGNWAISFGMPSKSPDVWRADVEWTRTNLDPKKQLAVSVVATVAPDWTMDQVAADYARCAQWAVDAGADLIEINLSCPNVATCDGQLYQQPEAAKIVAEVTKAAIGATPLLAKIGFIPDNQQALELLDQVASHVDGLIMVNGISARVRQQDGRACFDGESRGIGGRAIFESCRDQVARFRNLIRDHGFAIEMIGCGGVSSADDVGSMLASGASMVQLATAAMVNPAMGLSLRQELGETAH